MVYLPDVTEVPDYLTGVVEAGDMVITMGAGDVWVAARTYVELLEEKGVGE